jgi:hypothetical protein
MDHILKKKRKYGWELLKKTNADHAREGKGNRGSFRTLADEEAAWRNLRALDSSNAMADRWSKPLHPAAAERLVPGRQLGPETWQRGMHGAA